MSLKLIKGEGNDYLCHFFGLVRDGAAWDKRLYGAGSTDAWYMYCGGSKDGHLYSNGNYRDESALSILGGQIVSMEASLV